MGSEQVYTAVKSYLEAKYGPVVVEVSRMYDRRDLQEVAGRFRRVDEVNWRRFTLLIEKDTLKVVGFGMR
ncbi:MAG: hypothetical protein NZ941_08110 [Candidatus Caldarchaeum sp.]|nr:hypothetical protein [Candidatus Caldarchaeum sp.]MDW7978312.1 hypothetical protein [Candidatus Caldarchaeum sp.]